MPLTVKLPDTVASPCNKVVAVTVRFAAVKLLVTLAFAVVSTPDGPVTTAVLTVIALLRYKSFHRLVLLPKL